MEKQKVMKWLLFLLLIPAALGANNREKYNFNPQWLLHVGDVQGAEKSSFLAEAFSFYREMLPQSRGSHCDRRRCKG